MKEIVSKKILKEVGVLLIVIVMVLSTVAVTADTDEANTDDIKHMVTRNSCVVNEMHSSQVDSRAFIWDNGYPNEVNGLCCQRGGTVVADLVDDFHLTSDCTIGGVEWDSVDDPEYIWAEVGDMIIYEYMTNGPGAEVVTLLDVPNTREYIGILFSRPWYRYMIDLVDLEIEFDLPAGDYYILLRPVSNSSDGQNFWLTSDAPSSSASQVYFRSDFFGYYDWTTGDQAFGEFYDVNFRLFDEGGSPAPDLDCDGELTWNRVRTGSTVTDSFTVENVGDPGSLLDWEVESYPAWGTWTFDPESGTGLPEGDSVTVDVEVVAPDEKKTTFEGEVKIVNSEDPDDYCIIDVTLITPYSFLLPFIDFVMQRFPILRYIILLNLR